MNILVMCDCGYIGSHICLGLLQVGFKLKVLDNLSNSSIASLLRVESLTGKHIDMVVGDITDRPTLIEIFSNHREIKRVVNLASLKAVGQHLEYYDCNILGKINLLDVITEFKCYSLIFSLYFNPIGAHSSGVIGVEHSGTPNNLLPFISQASVGLRDLLTVFGGNYPTPDGTGDRDYIHVGDLAKGHLNAYQFLLSSNRVLTLNLGTGRGYSVLETISDFERASGHKMPYSVYEGEQGGVAQCYAKQVLGLSAEFTIDRMCEDTWLWQSKNPQGFSK